jgi:hypothetical protein
LVLVKIATANFTPLRPSRIPARKNKNSVRRCYCTVRGLMFQPACNFLVARARDEQVQDRLIAGRQFDLIEIDP